MRCTVGLEYELIGVADGTTIAGVDYAGVAFLLREPFDRQATIYAFRACYRNLSPMRFQIWRPTQCGSGTDQNCYRLITEVVHQSESETTSLPALETVSMIAERDRKSHYEDYIFKNN